MLISFIYKYIWGMVIGILQKNILLQIRNVTNFKFGVLLFLFCYKMYTLMVRVRSYVELYSRSITVK